MSPRSRRTLLRGVAAALPAAVAGCTARSPTSPTATSRRSTDAPTTPPATTTVRPTTTTTPGNATDYGDLSADARAFFRTLVGNGSVERPIDRVPSPFGDLGAVGENATVVRRNGTRFEVAAAPGHGMVAVYTLRLRSVGGSGVEDSEVVAFADLPADGRRAVERALESGRYTHRGQGFLEGLAEYEYVEHDGTYYEMRVAVGDVPVLEYSVTNASEQDG